MSDRAAESGVVVWIALRRAHEGGVANLAGQWLDSGHRVPGYVADAMDELTSAGLLELGEEDHDSCSTRRITVTDAGCAHYVALCQVHNPQGRAAVSTPQRWARSPRDQRSHLLMARGTDQIGVLIGVCGHRMLWSVPTSEHPTGRTCPTCQALPGVPVPAAQFDIPPDSGRPPVERPPRSVPAPGGRPDTTAPMTSARHVADADRGDRPPGGHEPRSLGVRRGSPRADQAVINPCVQLPVTSADPVTGRSPGLAVTLVLQRAHHGGVGKLGARYQLRRARYRYRRAQTPLPRPADGACRCSCCRW